jgi:hypothetical protein
MTTDPHSTVNMSPYHWDTALAAAEVVSMPSLQDKVAMATATEFEGWLRSESWLTRVADITWLRMQASR